MTHSTHFIYGYMEGIVLFNDALNTFYFYIEGRKEGIVLFHNTLNTFYFYIEGRKCFI